MADEVEDTFEKQEVKLLPKKVTDPSKDLGDEYQKEKGKEHAGDYGQNDESGEVASREPTANY